MKTYRVLVDILLSETVEVEAENKEEAEKKAEQVAEAIGTDTFGIKKIDICDARKIIEQDNESNK